MSKQFTSFSYRSIRAGFIRGSSFAILCYE